MWYTYGGTESSGLRLPSDKLLGLSLEINQLWANIERAFNF